MDVKQRLGSNIKKLRKERGWSQEDFAAEAGIHRTYASDLERGVRNPSILVVEKLALSLGVSAGSLLD
jgi:transcriptional regulator with XRE-family HTH domain